MQGKSESSFATVKLAGGPQSLNYAVNVTLQIYDVYGAESDAQKRVFVIPVTNTTQQNNNIRALIGANSGSVDGTKAVIGTASSALNAVNCTGAPSCASLNRYACSSKAHTCDACLPGFIGVAGSQNSACLSLTNYINSGADNSRRRLTVGHSCANSTQCNEAAWEYCDSSRHCALAQKGCTNNCTDFAHGHCAFESASTGASLTSCGISDSTCNAVCT